MVSGDATHATQPLDALKGLLKNVEQAARLLAFRVQKHRRAACATAFSTGT